MTKPVEQDLPLDMKHTVISEKDEQVMVEMNEKARDKRVKRPRKQMHDYVQELLEVNIKYNMLKAKYEQEVEDHNVSRDKVEFPTIRQALVMLWRAVSMKVRGV